MWKVSIPSYITRAACQSLGGCLSTELGRQNLHVKDHQQWRESVEEPTVPKNKDGTSVQSATKPKLVVFFDICWVLYHILIPTNCDILWWSEGKLLAWVVTHWESLGVLPNTAQLWLPCPSTHQIWLSATSPCSQEWSLVSKSWAYTQLSDLAEIANVNIPVVAKTCETQVPIKFEQCNLNTYSREMLRDYTLCF